MSVMLLVQSHDFNFKNVCLFETKVSLNDFIFIIEVTKPGSNFKCPSCNRTVVVLSKCASKLRIEKV